MAKKIVVSNIVSDISEVLAAKPEPVLKTFKVRRTIEYTVKAANEYHVENKVNKLAKNAEYAAENPVDNYTVSTVIVETVS